MTQFLIPLPTHYFLLDDANTHGVDAALVLYYLRNEIETNRNNEEYLKQGLYWCSTSAPALLRKYPYFNNRKKIDRILKKLIDENVIIDGKFNKVKSDHTKWYALKPAETLMSQNWEDRPETAETLMSQKWDIEVPNMGHGSEPINTEQIENIELTPAETLMSQKRDIEVPNMGDRSPKNGTSHNMSKKSLLVNESRDLDFDFIGNQIVNAYNQFANQYEKIRPHKFIKNSTTGVGVIGLLETYTVEQILKAIEKIQDSKFLKGQVANQGGDPFSLNITYLLSNFEKLAKGFYDDKPKASFKKSKPSFAISVPVDAFANVTDWQTALNDLIKINHRSAETRLKHVEAYISESTNAQFIIEQGHELELRARCFKFCHRQSYFYSSSDIDREICPKFPDLFVKAKKAGAA